MYIIYYFTYFFHLKDLILFIAHKIKAGKKVPVKSIAKLKILNICVSNQSGKFFIFMSFYVFNFFSPILMFFIPTP